MQIKKHRFHLTPVRMVIIKKTNNKCWWGNRKKEHLHTVGGNSHYGNQYGGSSKN
jgi:hypothetical protein